MEMRSIEEIILSLHDNCEEGKCRHTEIGKIMSQEFEESKEFEDSKTILGRAALFGPKCLMAVIAGIITEAVLAGIAEGKRMAEIESLEKLIGK
jgi:hypothetical protein